MDDNERTHQALLLLWSNDGAIAASGVSLLNKKNTELRKKIIERLRTAPYPVAAAIVSALGFDLGFIEENNDLLLRLFAGWKRQLKTDSVFRLLEARATILPPEALLSMLPHDNALQLLVKTLSPLAFEPARAALEDEDQPNLISVNPLDFARIDHEDTASVLIRLWMRYANKFNEHEVSDLINALAITLPQPDAVFAFASLIESDSLFVRQTACEALRATKIFASVKSLSKLVKSQGQSR